MRYKNMFYVIKHVKEEGAGLFTDKMNNMKIIMAESMDFPDIREEDIVVIMGGPMGVYEKDKYPFIELELEFIRRCYKNGAKILGICLGAQMIAEALGGKVYKGHVKEIGWYEITHTNFAKKDKAFSVFPEKIMIFQWHQDTFTLPENAVRLAFNSNYENQAFTIEERVYGLQYHIEVTEDIIKEWFPDDYNKYIDKAQLDLLRLYAYEFFQKFIK
ncbi:MAG: type 1 glutamine amidotransferase [Proteobacteria bacterium]|nr:type 1 glutamine amidotransferase [Pseudomonadota bacterium]